MTKLNKPDSAQVVTPEENKKAAKGEGFASKKELSNLKVRACSTVVLLTLLLIYVVSGAIYTSFINSKAFDSTYFVIISLLGSVFLISISIWEMNRALGLKHWWIQTIIILLALLLFAAPIRSSDFLPAATQSNLIFIEGFYSTWLKPWIFWVLAACSLIVFIVYAVTKPHLTITRSLLAFIMMIVIVFAYKGFTILCLSVTDTGEGYKAFYSFNTVIWIWMIIILTDTFAYLGGMKFGKTKLAPQISPKKTWEGASIGFVAGFSTGALYAVLFFAFNATRDYAPFTATMSQNNATWIVVLWYILISAAFSIIGQIGDLLFSWIKRSIGIKDYSRIVPGHGGVLDRLDSFTFAFFVVFFITIFIR
ncbi:phosphatidate cytidylyltransferase [Spiroplasma sabaudiense Ar-1343]|uniref:Phosphatidate cytidylyltransferase n=1 Tax=Spiroplasma sabaudiense Ar-1343 TaxID=1276257 RepID=W6A9X8_9MOLU|nr:phosphatidate cytidylyltransferase [Spiroplasma sabaudiense]AHI53983.1 phosphatidate cytidylyltransferase [Spiroplasma sabaudiense Ar-1343]